MAELLPGAPVAERLTQDLKARSDALRQRGVVPTLAIIRVGRDPGGLAYEKGAASRCAKCGIDLRRIPLDDAASLPEVIRSVNDDPAIHGCLLLRPLADKAAEEAAGRLLSPDKDVDGMTPGSLAGLLTGRGGFAPCTAQACLELLDYYGVDPAGRRAVVIGRSLVVGQPAALLLQRRNATVTVCHTGTRDIPALSRDADIVIAAAGRPGLIVIAAAGRPGLITVACLRPGQTVLDVGVHPGPDGTLCGDVAPEAAGLDLALTPVPGGVGSVTSAVLCKHTIQAAENTRL